MADYDVSNLSTYLEQQKGMLIRASLLEGKTASKITIQPGIKFQEAINILDVNPSIILGGNDCSDFTASGTTIYKQRTIEVCDLLAEDNLCAAKLNKYFLQNQIAPGKAGDDSIPNEEQLFTEIKDYMVQYLDKLAWTGNYNDGSRSKNFGVGELSLCDGFLKILQGETTPVTANTATASRTAFTGLTNTVAAIRTLIRDFAADADCANDLTATDLYLFVGQDQYNIIVQAYINANLTNFVFDAGTNYEFKLPEAPNITVVGTVGLNETQLGVLVRGKYLVQGVDLLSDADDIEVWKDQNSRNIRYRWVTKVGFQVAFPERVGYIGVSA